MLIVSVDLMLNIIIYVLFIFGTTHVMLQSTVMVAMHKSIKYQHCYLLASKVGLDVHRSYYLKFSGQYVNI